MDNNDYKIYTIRDAAILTNSYVAGTVIGDPNLVYEKNQLVLLCDFTIGSLDSASVKLEFSSDGTNYYQETLDDVDFSTGVITEVLSTRTFTASGSYIIAVPLKYRWIKVSAIGTGTVTGSELAISATVGVV